MSHCRECGSRLPDDKFARFCPNCGAAVADLKTSRTIEPSPTLRSKISWRIKTLIIAIIICLVVTFFGAVLPIDPTEAQDIFEEFEELEKITPTFITATIYGNNLMHCVIMFTPFVGPFYGVYVLFSTGRALASIASVQGANPAGLFAVTFIFPHAWIEYVSYALAISESFWLGFMIVKRRFKGELANLFKAISACALLLLSAAFIESYLISFLVEVYLISLRVSLFMPRLSHSFLTHLV